jgi:hypothetical protein
MVFILALAYNLIRGLDINCGCFGSGDSTLIEALVKDLFLLIPCALLIFYSNTGKIEKATG